tara:strand:- start:947 stop:1699 length:753 start_codon:yes stop_codon:yes gene_type:complete
MTSPIPNWDCTKPGINTLDELHRSLRDVQRLTEIWASLAHEHLESASEPNPERGQARFRIEAEARRNWTDWVCAIDRVYRAIDIVDFVQIGYFKSEVLEPVGVLNRLFPHSITAESDGVHLLHGLHPLGVDRRGMSCFPSEQVDKANIQINKVVDVLILAAPRHIDLATPTKHAFQSPTKSQLIDKAGISGSTFDRIRAKAGIPSAGKGADGQNRTYTQDELVRLIHAAGTGGKFRDRIVQRWSELLPPQ